MPHIEGDLRSPTGARYAIIASRWNPRITDTLVAGARKTFTENGVAEDAVDVIRVPGAWELPVAAANAIDRMGYAGIVAYEPTELVITARCGTPLAELEAAVAAAGQMLAFEPYGAPGATIGGARWLERHGRWVALLPLPPLLSDRGATCQLCHRLPLAA